jgi:hypothetical protein
MDSSNKQFILDEALFALILHKTTTLHIPKCPSNTAIEAVSRQ